MKKTDSERIKDKISELESIRKEQEVYKTLFNNEYYIIALVIPILIYIHSVKPVNWNTFTIVALVAYFLTVVTKVVGHVFYKKYLDLTDQIQSLYGELVGRKVKPMEKCNPLIISGWFAKILTLTRYCFIGFFIYLIVISTPVIGLKSLFYLIVGIIGALILIVVPAFISEFTFTYRKKNYVVPDKFGLKYKLMWLADKSYRFMPETSLKLHNYVMLKAKSELKRKGTKNCMLPDSYFNKNIK